MTAYEDFKRNHMNTARLCADAGLSFEPLVVEANGGMWGISAQKIFSELAKLKAIIQGESKGIVLDQIYQSLDVILHRENARAVLKRMQPRIVEEQHLASAAATVQAATSEAVTMAT